MPSMTIIWNSAEVIPSLIKAWPWMQSINMGFSLAAKSSESDIFAKLRLGRAYYSLSMKKADSNNII